MDILYRDEFLIAVNKPSGLLVHRSPIDRHENRFALQLLRDRIGQRVYPLHRLDKPTSGVLLFALDSDSAGRMMPVFSDGLIRKRYLAIVRGYTEETDVIDYPLREEADRMSAALFDSDRSAQPAVTHFRRLATVELPVAVGRYATARYSLLGVSPKTGRRHQIRRHLKHIFHPVIGDTTHGDGRHNRFFRDELACRRLLLAATQVSFRHPLTSAQVCIRAPLDREFSAVIDCLGWADCLHSEFDRTDGRVISMSGENRDDP
jgi:tRNA pseudouridine65 synthase